MKKRDPISEAMKEATKDWDVKAIANAVIADDPDVMAIHNELIEALNDMKAGRYAKAFTVELSPIAQTRHKTGLTQRLFAERLGISVNTLKSWEQGKRQPSGSANALIKLITKKIQLWSYDHD